MKHPYQTLSSRVVWQTAWFKVREDQVQFPDGSSGAYTLIDKSGAVFIVPVLPDGRFVLIHEYRHPVQDWVWGVPAGGIKTGQTPEQAARAELAEEIGGSTENLQQISEFFTVPGNSTEAGFVFLARDVTLGIPNHEYTEVMNIHVFSATEVQSMITRNEIKDAPSLLSLFLAFRVLETNAKQ